MKYTLYKFVFASVSIFLISTIGVFAQGEKEAKNVFPLYTQIFNKILYGTDAQQKSVNQMIQDIDRNDVIPYNAQKLCEGSKCYTWDAFLDKDILSAPIKLSDIQRAGASGSNISCPINQAIQGINPILGKVSCIPVKLCYKATKKVCPRTDDLLDRRSGKCFSQIKHESEKSYIVSDPQIVCANGYNRKENEICCTF